MRILYTLYLLLILPLALLLTILTALTVIIFSPIFGHDRLAYWPGCLWSRALLRLLLMPVHVEGRENIAADKQYIFAPNHESALDIFLIYGFLGHPFKWMMKKELARIPLVGYACKCCGFIYVDRENKKDIARTMAAAADALGTQHSMCIFPEGSRTRDGQLTPFKRGAFKLAHELQMPVVPITIDGCYEAMPRHRWLIRWHRLRLVVHAPIEPCADDPDDIGRLRDLTHDVILSAL